VPEPRQTLTLATVPDPDDLPRVLTTQQVARILGVSIGRVRRLETSGKLNPTRDRKGVRHFERAEILQLAHARGQRLRCELAGGPKAAEAFGLFDKRLRLADVVIKLQLVPELVRELHAQWKSFQSDEPRPVVRLGDAPAVEVDDGEDLDRDLRESLRGRQSKLRKILTG
jgi:DNA-binding transcriptional MerR regulator